MSEEVSPSVPTGSEQVNPGQANQTLYDELRQIVESQRLAAKDTSIEVAQADTGIIPESSQQGELDQAASTSSAGAQETVKPPLKEKTKEVQRKEALDTLPDIVRETLFKESNQHGKNFDPTKVVRILPIIEGLNLKDPEKDKPVIVEIATMAHCEEISLFFAEGKEESEESTNKFIEFVAKLQETGANVRGLLDLARVQNNMDKIVNLYVKNPMSLQDKESPLGLIVRLANLQLADLAPAEKESSYYQSPSESGDIRDIVIDTIAVYISTDAYVHKRVSEHISMIEAKLPQLQQSGFPLEMIGGRLLQGLDPSLMQFQIDYGKIMDRATKIGGLIINIRDISPELAESAIGEDRDTNEILGLAAEISKAELEIPEAYTIFQVIRSYKLIDTPAEIKRYLDISKAIASNSELLRLVKGEKLEDLGNGTVKLPENLNVLLDIIRYDTDLEKFTENADTLRGLFGMENIVAKNLFLALIRQPEEVRAFLSIMQDPSVQEFLSDPGLAEQINSQRTIRIILDNLDIDCVKSALQLYKTIEINNRIFFELGDMLDGAAKLRHDLEGVRLVYRTELSETYQLAKDIYLSALTKASKKFDKNGYPLDTTESVSSAVRTAFKYTSSNNESASNKANSVKELLDWFEQSGLPYFAFPVVMDFKEGAEAQGKYTAKEVYDWVFNDTELLKLMSHKNVISYITESYPTPPVYEGLSPEEIIAKARKEVLARADSFRVIMNLKPEALIAAHGSEGDLMSIFDGAVEHSIGKKRGTGYFQQRNGVEIALGIRSLAADEEHRVYGSCAFIDKGVPPGAHPAYGRVVLVFSPTSAKIAETTFTPKDSFKGAMLLSKEDAMLVRHLKDTAGIGGVYGDEYVESQIPGDVTVFDAEQIVVTSEEEAVQLRSAMPELASKIVVRPLPS